MSFPVLTAASFLKVDEIHPKTGTPYRATGERDYVREFLVEMDNPKWGILEVGIAPGLPSAWSPYINPYTGFFDGLALLTEATITRKTDTGRVWTVACKYTTAIPRSGPQQGMSLPQMAGGSHGGSSDNPQLEPPEVEYEFEEVNIPARRDLDGRAFTNSAWQPFTPTPTLPYQRAIFTLSRNELRFNLDTATELSGATNSKPWAGFPKDAVLCMAPRAKMMWRGSFRYWRVTYRLKFGYRKENGIYETFQHEELDQGFWERRPEFDGMGDPVMDPVFENQQLQNYSKIYVGGVPATKPVLLNGDGLRQREWRQVNLGQPGEETPIYALIPVFLEFRTRRRLDFNKIFNQGLGAILPP